MSKQVVYVGPSAEVEHPVVSLHNPMGGPPKVDDEPITDPWVRRGDTIRVPDDIYGTAPRPAKGEPGSEDYDPGDLGSGLLAQPSNWANPGTKAAKEAKAAAAQAPPEDETPQDEQVEGDASA